MAYTRRQFLTTSGGGIAASAMGVRAAHAQADA